MGRGYGRLGSFGLATLLSCVASGTQADARLPALSTLDLSTALGTLARQPGVELIFDPAQVAGIKVAPQPAPSVKAALEFLLAKTRFTYRQADAHTFVIVSRSIKTVDAPRTPPPSAGPEIVVTGLRSQNIDLVRGKDEIQPYWVTSAEAIASSGAETLDDYFRSHLALNRDTMALSQQGASPRSQIDLRGMGTDQTLVLVDGRRFATISTNPGLFDQSDINAIPVEAVERIEVLATSAGGIFGIGATGGAVNIILKRDYDGALLSADRGVTTQGDGVQQRFYARFGWKSPSGRTHVMVSGSYAHDDGLLVGDRPYAIEQRALRVGSIGYADGVTSNSLNIQSLTGAPLTLTAAYGGAALGSSSTFMPITSGALDAAGIATLEANAGKQDISLAADGQGAGASLIAKTTRLSAMATIRQDIGARSELFVDYLRLDDRGYQLGTNVYTGGTAIAPGQAGNPFNQYIIVSFPTALPAIVTPERNLAQRVSAGLIRRFAGGWSLEADGAYSVTSIRSAYFSNFVSGTPRVFDGRAILDGDLQPIYPTSIHDSSTNRLGDGNVRLTGPFAHLPGGAATITVTGEYRHESSAGFDEAANVVLPGSVYTSSSVSVPHSQKVWSAFGEARLPILPDDGPVRPWRGLAAQVALRFDRYTLLVPTALNVDGIHNQGSVLASTLGLQSRPIDGLMLRTSFSDAGTPPSPLQLQSITGTMIAFGYSDPRRGGAMPYDPNYRFAITYGNPALRPQKTATFSAGAVLEPDRLPGLRLSVDYTSLIMRHTIETFADGDVQYFLDYESLYPGRVQRAALTSADQALGYTGGRITAMAVGPLQTGHARLQTLDFAASYDVPVGSGKLHLQADADWALSYRRISDPRAGTYDLVGYADGPIAWRTNFGAEWASERWSIGTQAQLYAPYSLAAATPLLTLQKLTSDLAAAQIVALQQREPRVPMQAYFDLSIAFRPQGKAGMQIRVTVANIFDKQPPVVASILPPPTSSNVDPTPASGAAYYGDLRGRRIAVNVSIPLRL